jgi:uncharacterized membrane protein
MPRWLLYTLLAVVCWGIWALLGKVIGDALSPGLTQALSTIGLLPIMLVLWRRQSSQKRTHQLAFATRGKLFALGAGVITCLGNIAYYDVLNRGAKASMVVPLTALYPLVTVLLALVVLKEQLNLIQGLGIALSLVAIYLFNVPQEQGFLSVWLLLALIPIALWGIAGLLQKLATNHISGEVATLWFLLAFVPVAVGILVLERLPALISDKTWLLVASLGFTFALGNLGLLAAFANNGKASVIAPLAGLYPLVSIPIALVALHERIGWREGIGIVLALISVIALSWETRGEEKRFETSNIQQPTAK